LAATQNTDTVHVDPDYLTVVTDANVNVTGCGEINVRFSKLSKARTK
jgi:hypothetical protein